MSSENEKDSRSILMFNPFKFWKNIYFAGEDSMSLLTRKAVETTAFASGVDLVLNSYLQYLRMQKELSNLFTESLPFSTRVDNARVAKLVVSLENKVDRIEDELFTEIEEIKENTQAWARISAIEEELGEIKTVLNELKENTKQPARKTTRAKKES
ncbi:MAG: hypothetical protein ABFD08_11980 [Syntrophomonas sp.]